MINKEKIKEIIAGVIVYGLIGFWLLISFLESDQKHQETAGWFILGGFIYWDITRRIDNLHKLIKNDNE